MILSSFSQVIFMTFVLIFTNALYQIEAALGFVVFVASCVKKFSFWIAFSCISHLPSFKHLINFVSYNIFCCLIAVFVH